MARRQSRCSVAGMNAAAGHGGRAPTSGRTNAVTEAATCGADAAAALGGAGCHRPTVAQRGCRRRRRRHYPPSPPWVKQEEGAQSVVGVSSNQDSSSVSWRRAEGPKGAWLASLLGNA